MKDRTCMTCQWNANGYCRRNPPAMPYPNSRQDVACWPPVQSDDWCGEYQRHREDDFPW